MASYNFFLLLFVCKRRGNSEFRRINSFGGEKVRWIVGRKMCGTEILNRL